jgi:hypothetical protein
MIEKNGRVTISDEGVFISGFTFNTNVDHKTFSDCQNDALLWGIGRMLDVSVFAGVLDAIAIALADDNHVWSPKLRGLYIKAIKELHAPAY